MQTGEYRGFVGQFSVWLRAQVVTWRIPLLLSLALHLVFFWPQSLQEHGVGATVVSATGAIEARLRAPPPTLPEVVVSQQVPARHAPVTQSSPSSTEKPAVTPHAAPVPVESSGLVLQPTEGLDAGAVRAYRIAWARALVNSGLRETLRADMQGVLEVGVAVSASGQVRDIVVLTGSGDAALDAMVIAAMRNAAPVLQPPATMLGREVVLPVPLEVGGPPLTSGAGR